METTQVSGQTSKSQEMLDPPLWGQGCLSVARSDTYQSHQRDCSASKGSNEQVESHLELQGGNTRGVRSVGLVPEGKLCHAFER